MERRENVNERATCEIHKLDVKSSEIDDVWHELTQHVFLFVDFELLYILTNVRVYPIHFNG